MTRVVVRAARWVVGFGADVVYLAVGVLVGAWVLALVLCLAGLPTVPVWRAALLLLPFATVRLLMPVERWRQRLVGHPVPAPVEPPASGPLVRVGRALVGPLDRAQMGHLLLLAPVGLGAGLACAAVWLFGIDGLGAHPWVTALEVLPGEPIPSGVPDAQRRAVSVLLLLCAVPLTRWLARTQARATRARLDTAHRSRLEQVVASRARAIEAQTAELRRIERDLHDGAQARIVALHMQLGLLGRALRPLGPDAQPARERLGAAADTAQHALADLRRLVRGIHPPVLTDRGLAAALDALAADCAMPVDLDVEPDGRMPPTIEASAYFAVAEATANAAKHSGATRCRVAVARSDGVLRVHVVDDGCGGADPDGAGLRGLRHRVEALDGTMRVTSPVGGPTTVEVRLPCG